MTAYGLKARLKQLNPRILIKSDEVPNKFYHDLNYKFQIKML